MLPPYFKVLAEYFVIPLFVLMSSYALSGQFSLKYSAGTDFFIFFLSADIGAMVEYEDLRLRINPLFRQEYLSVFAVLLAASIFLVIVSGLTQRQIEAWREEQQKKTSWRYRTVSSAGSAVKYPLVGVILCWVFTITLMPTELFVFFGKG